MEELRKNAKRVAGALRLDACVADPTSAAAYAPATQHHHHLVLPANNARMPCFSMAAAVSAFKQCPAAARYTAVHVPEVDT